jgi:outer membrane protein OmpA-like peptidoglycan-associated protein
MKALYSILLVGLFFWGYTLCNKHLCGNKKDTTAAAATTGAAATAAADCDTSLTVNDGDNFQIKSDENFQFALSEDGFQSPSDEFLNSTINIIDYLQENSERVLQIRGYYLETEENLTEEKNLGVARAKSIANYFVDNGVATTQIQVASKRAIASCVEDDILLKGTALTFTSKN